MVILIILVFALIAGIEIPSLVKRKYKKELALFSIFLFFGFVFSLLFTAGVDLPDPVDSIKALLNALQWHF